jgi:hypothetical protein
MDDAEPLQSALRTLAEEARREAGPHPGAEELLAYHQGGLAAAERERLQDHLALCRACARTVLDLAAFPEVADRRGDPPLPRERIAAAWERLERDAAPAPVVPFARRRPAAWLPYAAAAALLVATVGLAYRAERLERQVRDLAGPRVNVQVGDLLPLGEAAERSGGEGQRLRLAPGTERLLLLLDVADPGSFPEYRVEIARAGGGVVWSHGGLRHDAAGRFTVELPRRLLPPGAYTLTLYGLGDLPATRLARYAVQVEGE